MNEKVWPLKKKRLFTYFDPDVNMFMFKRIYVIKKSAWNMKL